MAQILVVDDDDVWVRRTLVQTLMLQGHLVFGTGRGQQALEMHDELGFDLVLVDMKLPDLDGLSVIQALGKALCPPRIVAMSGWGQSLLDKAEVLGAEMLLEKPFGIQKLLDFVAAKAA